jgi:hypothetical protein
VTQSEQSLAVGAAFSRDSRLQGAPTIKMAGSLS